METLIQVKLLHTVIWAVMAAACVYVLYAGITGTENTLVWACIGIILLEGLVLAVNKGACPLTPIARRYTADHRDNFDIYLPELLARYNKWIFGSIFTVGLLLFMIR